jgi:hypothetical protein
MGRMRPRGQVAGVGSLHATRTVSKRNRRSESMQAQSRQETTERNDGMQQGWEEMCEVFEGRPIDPGRAFVWPQG